MKVEIGDYPKGRQKRHIKIEVEDFDTYSADITFAIIASEVLKKLKQKKIGSPKIDNEDVPENLRCCADWIEVEDDRWHRRWDYIIDEMIWAFDYIKSEQHIPIPKDEEDIKRLTKALNLFGKYYLHLWW